MELLIEAYRYWLQNQAHFWEALSRHLILSLSALAISLLIGLPLGIWISRHHRSAQWVINGFGALRLVPSLAILFLALPYLGTGFRPALFALTLQSPIWGGEGGFSWLDLTGSSGRLG